MSALTRIFERVREQLAELGESIAGNQAQRELDEEIRAADAHMRELRAGVASLQARRFTAQERIEATVAAILQREAQALASLEVGKDALAREVATAIVQLEHVRDDEQAFVLHLDEQIAQLRHLLEQGENGLRRLQHQLDVLRAAETVQRAQETIAGRQHGTASLPQNAIESLLRARSQHPSTGTTVARGEPWGDPELDARLEAAGIDGHDARIQLVLDRIGQRHGEAPRSAGRSARQASVPRTSR